MDISEIIEKLTIKDIIENTMILLAIIALASWLLKTSLARNALDNCKPRRNKLNPILAIAPLLFWYSLLSIAFQLKNHLIPDLTSARNIIIDNIIISASAAITAILTLILAKKTFARGLKGFGLHTKNIFKDFARAIAALFTAWPLLMLMFLLSYIATRLIKGPDSEIPQHQELEFIAQNPQVAVRIMIALTTTIIVPIFEELIFRGMIQSTIRAYLKRPWPSLLLSALIFATVHANIEHWPVIFVLGVTLGYSYEKTNRLYPSMFIHALFNASAVIATILQS